jgi:hypothetical protein
MTDLWSGAQGPDRLKRLEELWKSGATGALAAKTLTDEFGEVFTRNAVMGKASRLKLLRDRPGEVRSRGAKRGSEQRAVMRIVVRPKPAPAPAPTFEEAPIVPEPETAGVNYLDNMDGCRALIGRRGDDGLEMCCGKRRGITADGGESSFCPEHHRRFYQGQTEIRTWRRK